jgi:hypothetical protein
MLMATRRISMRCSGVVPARCTVVAQPYDAGIIAMVKGKLLCDQLLCADMCDGW